VPSIATGYDFAGWQDVQSLYWRVPGTGLSHVAVMDSIEVCWSSKNGGNGGGGNGGGGGGNQCSFTYDGATAAHAAYRLAQRSSSSYQPVETPHSAYFMSLAHYAGGIPMIDQGQPGSDWGWSATVQPNRTLLGNATWRNHNATDVFPGQADYSAEGTTTTPVAAGDIGGGRLIHFLRNGTGVNLGLPPPNQVSLEFDGREAFVAPLRAAFDENDQLRAARIGGIVGALATVEPGDYVFIDSAGETHGFMAVGLGPMILCEPDVLDDVTYDLATGAVSCSSCTTYPLNQTAHQVPYVVDWNGDVDDQQLRPFYCSYYAVSGHRKFDHDFWMFIPGPTGGDFNCAAGARNNIDDHAPFWIDPSTANLVDPQHGTVLLP
jgi:hypothetical protein